MGKTDSMALEWLLENDQPAIRYHALTDILGKGPGDPGVAESRKEAATRGWGAEILSRMREGGWWEKEDRLYAPKYTSTNWMLLILSDLALGKDDRRIDEACRLWIERFAKKDGGFGADGSKRSHLCIVGNTARALVKFGYEDHPSVRRAFDWMAKNSSEKGGWSCFGSGRNLDSWEPMSAFAVYPRQKWTRSMAEVVEKGANFYLERELHIQGDHYEPWYRFHYPVHYYYDILVGLDFMTELGYTDDRRMKHSVDLLKKKRREDGTWILDAVHPDVEGGMADWYKKHPKHRPTPFSLERVGEPSKMITLKALTILKRIGDSGDRLSVQSTAS